MNGIELIAAERQRQIEQEGWTPEHDDEHPAGELALAGVCYAGHASLVMSGHAQDLIPSPWPWADEWWKPKDPLRDLVRAGALIAAEIDKLQRGSIGPIKQLPPAKETMSKAILTPADGWPFPPWKP